MTAIYILEVERRDDPVLLYQVEDVRSFSILFFFFRPCESACSVIALSIPSRSLNPVYWDFPCESCSLHRYFAGTSLASSITRTKTHEDGSLASTIGIGKCDCCGTQYRLSDQLSSAACCSGFEDILIRLFRVYIRIIRAKHALFAV